MWLVRLRTASPSWLRSSLGGLPAPTPHRIRPFRHRAAPTPGSVGPGPLTRQTTASARLPGWPRSSAVHRGSKRPAGLTEAHRVECTQTINEERLSDDSEIVEAGRALGWHPIV